MTRPGHWQPGVTPIDAPGIRACWEPWSPNGSWMVSRLVSENPLQMWDNYNMTYCWLVVTGTMGFGMTFQSVGNGIIIPTDFHSIIFQRGRYTTNQIVIRIVLDFVGCVFPIDPRLGTLTRSEPIATHRVPKWHVLLCFLIRFTSS